MKKRDCLLALCAALSVGAAEVKAPVTGAVIFRNGVSAVRRSADTGKQLSFDLAGDLQPLADSLWFSGPVISVVRQETKKPVAGTYPLDNLTKTFAGEQVTLLVSGDKTIREVTGTILDPDAENKPGKTGQHTSTPSAHCVWLRLADGSFEMIRQSLICGIRCAAKPRAAILPAHTDLRPVWHFTLARPAEKPVFIDYLTRGLQWRNAYRIELGKQHQMTIAQDVEIENNLADLDHADLYLASGQARFANGAALSPMAMLQPVVRTSRLLKTKMPENADFCMPLEANYAMATGVRFGEAATGESEDVSLLAIPDFSLRKGEVCHRIIGSAQTTFERLVHWSLRSKGRTAAMPMDAVRFTNPFAAPITAGTAEILDGGMVLAQVKIPWINPKQAATLDLSRALTVTGKCYEYEVAPASTERAEQVLSSLERNKQGRIVGGWLAGSRYRNTDVQGELRIRNFRNLPARFLIELDYSGTFVSADDAPAQEQNNRTMSINPNSKMSWDLTIPAGAEKVLKYRYNTFVNY